MLNFKAASVNSIDICVSYFICVLMPNFAISGNTNYKQNPLTTQHTPKSPHPHFLVLPKINAIR